MSLKQPVGQQRLTNVSIVKLKHNGSRFELACYPNKVHDWRAGVETRFDEVIQSPHIFSNVSKGIFANQSEVESAFGLADFESVAKEILSKGEVQMSEKERALELARLFRDTA